MKELVNPLMPVRSPKGVENRFTADGVMENGLLPTAIAGVVVGMVGMTMGRDIIGIGELRIIMDRPPIWADAELLTTKTRVMERTAQRCA